MKQIKKNDLINAAILAAEMTVKHPIDRDAYQRHFTEFLKIKKFGNRLDKIIDELIKQ